MIFDFSPKMVRFLLLLSYASSLWIVSASPFSEQCKILYYCTLSKPQDNAPTSNVKKVREL